MLIIHIFINNVEKYVNFYVYKESRIKNISIKKHSLFKKNDKFLQTNIFLNLMFVWKVIKKYK